MVTLGIDLASQAANTAVCRVTWAEMVTIDMPAMRADDALLTTLIGEADRVGIDVPLGWPVPFVTALFDYHSGRPWSAGHGDVLQLRRTDQFVREKTRKRPLSVSTDKIGIPAMRAANLLSAIDNDMDRTGQGKVVEVYPAAALRSWGFASEGYKREAGRTVRKKLVQSFVDRTRRWVEVMPEVHACCEDSDHAFDALIAALVARAAHLNLVHPVREEDVAAAQTEGWIALPTGDSLDQLA